MFKDSVYIDKMPPTRRASVVFADKPLFRSHSSPRSSPSTTRSSAGSTSNSTKSRRLNPRHELESEEEERDTGDDDEEEGDDSEDVIMAVDHRGRKIGCAFYSVADGKLSLMEDIEFPTSDCLDACGSSTRFLFMSTGLTNSGDGSEVSY